MSAATDVDLTVIEHLDFEPICELTFDKGDKGCNRPAAWLITWRGHCHRDATKTLFMCETDFRNISTGTPTRCVTCGGLNVAIGDIIRTERLKR